MHDCGFGGQMTSRGKEEEEEEEGGVFPNPNKRPTNNEIVFAFGTEK
jgi:hypothetical protein